MMKVIYQSILLTLLLVLLSGPVAAQSQTCVQDGDCPLINCLIPPCPAAVCRDGVCGIEDNPPNPECIQDSDCPQINCFVAPCDVNVCNGGLCELQPPPEEPDNLLVPEGVPCGSNFCTGGEPCCNPSCGICGQICTEQFCLDEEEEETVPEGIPCGSNVCTGGEPCCNESCGICGDFCTQQFCGDDEGEFVPDSNTLNPNTNDTMYCTTNGDCPSFNCTVPPCYHYICNTTAGKCLLGKEPNETLCGVNITCDDMVVLNASVADNVSILDVEEAVSKTDGDDSERESSSNGAESKSSRQFVVFQSIMAVMVATTSLLVFL